MLHHEDDEDNTKSTDEASSDDKRETTPLVSKNYLLGLVCILLVNVLWVGSALLIQKIFTGSSFDKPFFATYLSTSLFGFYLIGFFFFRDWVFDLTIPLGCTSIRISRTRESPVITLYRKIAGIETTPTDDLVVNNEKKSMLNENDQQNEGDGGERREEGPMTTGRIIKLASIFSFIWFFANYFYNKSLDLTTVSSNSILSSTSSFFTFLFAVIFRIEKPTIVKAASVLFSIGGVVMVTLADSQDEGERSVLGDILAILSAVVYAAYLLFLAAKVPEGSVRMPIFFGFVGFSTFVLLWPLGVVLNYTGTEPFELPDAQVWGFLLLNALFGTVISDCLWAWTVLLTTPTVAAVGMSLSVPLAMFADLLLGQGSFTFMYVSGAVLVIFGFLLCSLGDSLLEKYVYKKQQ